MDLRKLKKLIDLVEESGITELEVTEGEEKVRIVKQSGVAAAPTYVLPAGAPIGAPQPKRSSVDLDDEGEDDEHDGVDGRERRCEHIAAGEADGKQDNAALNRALTADL